jgi:hypothetical protein
MARRWLRAVERVIGVASKETELRGDGRNSDHEQERCATAAGSMSRSTSTTTTKTSVFLV